MSKPTFMRMVCGCILKEQPSARKDKVHIIQDMTDCKGVDGSGPKWAHEDRAYICARTNCGIYTPRRVPDNPMDWPRCVCGALAQDHD